VFAQRWLHRLPLPFGRADQRAGYWWEISMRQVEVSRTLVFDAPRRARVFFEALIADNLDIGRPANVEIIFSRHIRRDTPGVFRTAAQPVPGPARRHRLAPPAPPPRPPRQPARRPSAGAARPAPPDRGGTQHPSKSPGLTGENRTEKSLDKHKSIVLGRR
jgi:hypothetical protein